MMGGIVPTWEPSGSQDGFRVYLWAGAEHRERDRMRLVFPRLDWAESYAGYLNAGHSQCTSIDAVKRIAALAGGDGAK